MGRLPRVAIRYQDTTKLWSRRGTDLSVTFRELATALTAAVPARCVIDGEVVAWSDGRLDFGALQRRMATACRTRSTPVSFVAFDVLAVAGHDARDLPMRELRRLLEELTKTWAPPLQLCPVTTERDQAQHWLAELHVTGIEGLVVKGTAQRCEPGRRQW
jgi:ATP-dependent DNA ligase